jgi:threonine dehydrogenase-like Zn-dependent dehydrogenase
LCRWGRQLNTSAANGGRVTGLGLSCSRRRILGHLVDGTQAEAVRVPYADTSLHLVPDDVTNEQVIFLAPATRWPWSARARSGFPRS